MVTFEAGVFAVDESCSFTPPNTLPEGSLALGGVWRSLKVYFSPYVYFSLFLCQLAVYKAYTLSDRKKEVCYLR